MKLPIEKFHRETMKLDVQGNEHFENGIYHSRILDSLKTFILSLNTKITAETGLGRFQLCEPATNLMSN